MWRDLGYARESMSGATPYSWSEVKAYADLACGDITAAEASCLVDMSRAYCLEILNGNPLRKSPMERAR